jgi:transcriptional regulator with XRE-family HTH domain
MKDQLSVLLVHLGITATRFADEIGVQRSGISHILSGRNQPSYDFIIKIVRRYPEINLEWLVLGKGEIMASGTRKPDRIIPGKSRETDLVTNVTMPEQVILIYPDSTFKSLKPRKQD